jgi:hypothetical protein
MADPDIHELDQVDQARRTRYLLEKLMEKRQNLLIDRLITDYRGGKHSHDKALGFVAELSGMKEQIDECTRIMRGAS